MFQAVIVFGLATIVFALSRTIWLSIVALIAMGAADTISVVVRVTLAALRFTSPQLGEVFGVRGSHRFK
ncbi:hypothetical protein [Bradyrhizobium commune]|uniref:hypothetical protein n=1 Tax=Bradyrhizobium commune TaxID=83627 RepID=UPI003F60A1FC